jgi:hypothetical protein
MTGEPASAVPLNAGTAIVALPSSGLVTASVAASALAAPSSAQASSASNTTATRARDSGAASRTRRRAWSSRCVIAFPRLDVSGSSSQSMSHPESSAAEQISAAR